MKRRHIWFCLLGFIACAGLIGCGESGSSVIDDPLDPNPGAPTANDNQNDDSSVSDVPTGDNGDSTNNDSVGGVTTGPNNGSQESTYPQPKDGVAVRVRNESALRADVTLRFILDDAIAHIAFLRVRSGTITTIENRESADCVEAFGLDETGDVLPSVAFVFGIDFDEDTPAEYIIPADIPDEPPPDEPITDDVQPPTIKMLEPENDETLALGSTLIVRWTDTTASQEAVVRIYMQRADTTGTEDRTQVGPTVAAALDGAADELSIVLQDIDPGLYRIVGEIDDGTEAFTAVAPGWVEVVSDVDNVAPSITILSPLEEVELHEGEVLSVTWRVEGDNDNATVTFSLVLAGETGGTEERIVIGRPLGDDPGGDGDYQAELTMTGVRPGLYDLVGQIDVGGVVGADRVAGVVRILNDEPQLTFLEPANDFELDPGESFDVVWTDSDDNDNARILLLLDPDLDGDGLDGDEVLLVPPLQEDPDGTGDTVTVEIPAGVPKGVYRLAGTISDDLAEVFTRAQGLIHFGVSKLPDQPNPVLILHVPHAPLKVRLGYTIDVVLETSDVPHDADVRFYLSNLASDDGTVFAEVHTASVNLNGVNELTIPSSELDIPNDAWPRQFDLEVEVNVDGTAYTAVAPGAIWIRQEVEVLDVDMVNYECTPGSDPLIVDREFVGVEITWYGGGFLEREVHADVVFWLSDDGTVPINDEPDDQHRAFHTVLESPNIIRVEQIHISRVIAIRAIPGGEELRPAVDSGPYQVITAVEPEHFGRITSLPHPSFVEVCFPLQVPHDGG